MSNSSSTSGNRDIPPLEMMGAIAGRLLHDLANHLSVISGNAQFAQMVAENPEKVSKAVKSILKASEQAGKLVGKCGEFKQRFASQPSVFKGTEAVTAIRSRLRNHRGWKIEVEGEIENHVQMEEPWVVQAIAVFIAHAGAENGRLTFREVEFDSIPHRPGRRLRSAPPPLLFEACLQYESDRNDSIDLIKSAFENLPLLACYEMIQIAGGWVEILSHPEENHRTLIYFPMASEAS